MLAVNPYTKSRGPDNALRQLYEKVCSDHWSEKYGAKTFAEALEGGQRLIGVDPDRTRARVQANTMLYLCEGTAFQARAVMEKASQQILGVPWKHARAALESPSAGTQVVADATDFVTQFIHLSLDVYPRLLAPKLVSVQPLKAPSGYAFSMRRVDQTGRNLAELDTFDKTYGDDPGEGEQIAKVKMKLDKQLVESRYKKLMGEWSHESDVALRSQYQDMDIEDFTDFATADELAWEVDREVIDLIVAGATDNYYFDPTMDSAYEDLAPTEKQAYDRRAVITIAQAETDMQAVIFGGPNWAIAGSNWVQHLKQIPDYKSEQSNSLGDMSIRRMVTPVKGVFIGDAPVLHDPQLDPDLLLLGRVDPMDPFYAGFIYLPFGLASTLTGAWTNPNNLLTAKARALAFATHMVRARQFKKVWRRRQS